MEKYSEETAILIAQTGPLNGQRWALRKTLLIGRDANCDIIISDRQVSRHHARFTVSPKGIEVEDLGSKNGTHLNGQQLQAPAMLQDGDLLQIALAQKFVFLSSDATLPLDSPESQMPQPVEAGGPTQPTGFGRLRLEKRSRRVWIQVQLTDSHWAEKEILPPLSVSQFHLLEVLYENQGRVVSRQDLVVTIWGEGQSFEVSEQALDALVRRLRDRIGRIDSSIEYIVTVRGHGLRLENPLRN
jgi:predicted component of type VI protein secretion system